MTHFVSGSFIVIKNVRMVYTHNEKKVSVLSRKWTYMATLYA